LKQFFSKLFVLTFDCVGYYFDKYGLFTRKKENTVLTAERKRSPAVPAEEPHAPMGGLDELSDEEIRAKLDQLPEVEYPEAFIRELRLISEEADAQLASGELVPMTFEEFKAEVMRRRNVKNGR
jgi:hypothetical protein